MTRRKRGGPRQARFGPRVFIFKEKIGDTVRSIAVSLAGGVACRRACCRARRRACRVAGPPGMHQRLHD
eukprot:4390487-Pyramimonas_sp.AAC.1